MIDDIALIINHLEDDTEADVMRAAIDQYKSSHQSAVIILSSNSSKGKIRVSIGVCEELTERISAEKIAQSMSDVLGGKGGGRTNFANAGGSMPENINKAIKVAKDLIENS